MPELRLCSIEACGKPAYYTKDWCLRHYKRWKRWGDPLGGRASPGKSLLMEWMHAHAIWQSDDCLLWPFGKANYGYGEIVVNGRKRLAHNLMCELVHGPAPAGKTDAAHRCGNRLCCNPRHLRWSTRQENVDDTLVHGTRIRGELHKGAKITSVDVIEIRRLAASGVRCKELAARYNISPWTVYDLLSRRRWNWLS